MKNISYRLLGVFIFLTACSPAEDALYEGPASVSFVEETAADLYENASDESVYLDLRLTASAPLKSDLTVEYVIEGDGWQNRFEDLNGGKATFKAGEFISSIALQAKDNLEIDGDQSFVIELKSVSDEQVKLGLGGSETFRTSQLMVIDDEFDPCTVIGDALINQQVVLDYYDYYDPDNYSGVSDGMVIKPEGDDCHVLTVRGDAIYLFEGSFQLHVNEANQTVEIPQQLYGHRESRGSDYYIKSLEAGSYNIETKEMVVDILYYGYDAGIDPSEVDLDADGYDGRLTISLK